MRTLVFTAALVAAATIHPAELPGVVQWKGSELREYGTKLAPKMSEQKLASERLATWGNHLAMVAYREASGEAEVHQTQADVFVVQAGEATLVVGGEVEGGRTTAPGEVRAPSIKGGERKALAPGDIVHIPAKVPHQLLLVPGAKFTYFVVKVDTP
jgi:mannose-6-phosphate isomerase-like protein (cupin superfamily)